MPVLVMNFRTIFLLGALLVITACTSAPEESPAAPEWPTNLVTPIQGATFSLSESHLPGSSPESGASPRQGFVFIDGFVGQPLAADEPVIAIAEGEVIRIDHDHQEVKSDILAFWSQQIQASGFLGEFARDQLRGRQVWLRHPDGHISRYSHLAMVNPELNPGDHVEQGHPVGLVGNSGISAAEDESAASVRVSWELWSPDATTYLGEHFDAFEMHRLLGALFSERALPRYTREVLARVEAGQEPPAEYPPTELDSTGFNADVPETIRAGNAFTIPITWEAQEFEVQGIFAALEGQPMGLLEIDGGAMAIGTISIESDLEEVTVILGGADKYGRTLMGNRVIQVEKVEIAAQPLEVDASILDVHTEGNQELERTHIWHAAELSLRQRTPAWTLPFQAPIDGNIIGVFGQRLFHGMLRPQHPLPGILVMPTNGTVVNASNDGTVALVSELPIRGSTVVVAHGGGIVSVYARLDETHVSAGDNIQRGDPLGSLSESGDLQDRILLWEIHVAGTPTDPQNWLDRTLPQR